MRAKLKLSYITYTLLTLSILFFTNNISALSYQSDINVSFTFNPTISVSISNDLTIPNLTPGTTSDSNEINVNVSTNNVYGYNLYATVGNSIYNNTNLTNMSSNANYTFTTVSPTTNLSNLDTDNTWGYSYSLDNGSTWSNYNGLSLYTTDNPTRLNKTTEPSSDTINFKIAAKAGNTQPSGTYSNVINFIAVTKPSPITLADAYAAEGKELYHGYYKMQDMTTTICKETEDIGAQLQVIDIRDDKVYWISKLADNNCWMTQNLDFDIDKNKTYTHDNTDLGWAMLDENAIWQPTSSTIDFEGLSVASWNNSYDNPSSANPGDIYYYTSNSLSNDVLYGSFQDCLNAGYNDCKHYHAGNYYNYSAVVASNDTNNTYGDAPNSICPSNWKLPRARTNNDFNGLLSDQNIITGPATSIIYTDNGFDNIRLAPLYLTRAGYIAGPSINNYGSYGYYWASTIYIPSDSYRLRFSKDSINTGYNLGDTAYRQRGFSARCLAR